jgi:hypothetical protein
MISHTYYEKGAYTISAQAIDEYGAESDWVSQPIFVSKYREIHSQVKLWLENNPILYQFFSMILTILKTIKNQSLFFFFLYNFSSYSTVVINE